MIIDILCGVLFGFFFGNGIPYYVAGSTGAGENPSPFPKTAVANVCIGSAALLVAAVAYHFVNPATLEAKVSAAVGFALVGLIHARLWRNDPWKRSG